MAAEVRVVEEMVEAGKGEEERVAVKVAETEEVGMEVEVMAEVMEEEKVVEVKVAVATVEVVKVEEVVAAAMAAVTVEAVMAGEMEATYIGTHNRHSPYQYCIGMESHGSVARNQAPRLRTRHCA